MAKDRYWISGGTDTGIRVIRSLAALVSLCGVVAAQAAVLNEWNFEADPDGQSLSEAFNSGVDNPPAQFDPGFGSTVFTTNRELFCVGEATGAGGVWTNGALLNAGVSSATSGVHYLRYDVDYNLSSVSNDSGTLLGVYFSGTGDHVAGLMLGRDMGTIQSTKPAGRSLRAIKEGLAMSGTLTTVAELNLNTGAMRVWYTPGDATALDEGSPFFTTSNIPLATITNLRFQATGDFRPGSDVSNHAAVDNIRYATSWEEVIRAPVDVTAPPDLEITVSDSLSGRMESGATNLVSVLISNRGGSATNVAASVSPVNGGSFFSVNSSNSPAGLAYPAVLTNTFYLVSDLLTPSDTYTFDVSAVADGGIQADAEFSLIVGSRISYLTNQISEVGGGSISNRYEPGETLDIQVISTNSGAVTVSNVNNSLLATNMFSISGLTPSSYSSLSVGGATSTTYRVAIPSSADNGTYVFTVINAAGGKAWTNTFPLAVFRRGLPVLSVNTLTLNVTEGGVQQQQLSVSNGGNAELQFTMSDDARWNSVLAVDTAARPSPALSGGTALPLNDPSDNDYINAADSGESDTIDIGFSFPFYGTNYTKLYIDSNGAIMLSAANLAGNTNRASDAAGHLPLDDWRPLIAPFRHKQLQIPDASPVRYVRSSDRLTLIHRNVKFSAYPLDGTNLHFQTELFANGEIKFSYYTVNGSGLDQVAVGIQGSAGSYLNVDRVPESGKAVLIRPSEDRWVGYSASGSAVPVGGSAVITFTADGTSQVAGTVNNFNTIFDWKDGTSNAVAVYASVAAAVPELITPSNVLFYGNAGEVSSTSMILSNAGTASLDFVITNTSAFSSVYGGGAVSGSTAWDNPSFNETKLTLLDPHENAYITATNEGISALQPIGFDFPFYDGVYTQFSAGVNGGISLGVTNRIRALNDFGAASDTVPQRFIAPYWGNLLLDTNSVISFRSTETELIVTWQNMKQSGFVTGTNLTFQAVLSSDGRIEFRYRQLNGSRWSDTQWGIRSGSARNSGRLILPEDISSTTNEYGLIRTNIVDAIAGRAVSLAPSNYPAITFSPSQGTLPAGGSAAVTVYGNATALSPGGPGSVTNQAGLSVSYDAGTNLIGVVFVATNRLLTPPASPDALDQDGDGVSYDDELIAGTDPLDVDSVFTVLTTAGREISWVPAPGRTYTVWYTVDLTKQFLPLDGAVGLQTNRFTDTLHTAEPVIYYKVTVE